MAVDAGTRMGSTTNKFALSSYGGGRGGTALTRRDVFRRFLGEHSGGTDPMITGFGIVFFTKLPDGLTDGNGTQANWLTAMTNSFDLPDLTIESIDYEGRDGGAWHVPGAAKVNNEITLNMWEMAGVPTYTILSKWYQLMRNPHYGFMTETTWYHKNYKGQIMYCACTPDLHVVRHLINNIN